MKFLFDFNGFYEYPLIKICNPNREVLGFINKPHDLKISPTFNNITDVSFVKYSIEENYNLLTKYMVLHIDGFGYFRITGVSEETDGVQTFKTIEAQSYEIILNDEEY